MPWGAFEGVNDAMSAFIGRVTPSRTHGVGRNWLRVTARRRHADSVDGPAIVTVLSGTNDGRSNATLGGRTRPDAAT